ncbi:MAG: aspartate aminotransferase [Acidocella sp. 20-61-6]|nr:MAG: aspartate aminotransferase [Acidocella sp. 20-61-6]
MPSFAGRIARTEIAATFAMAAKARALREAGIDVISLSIGEPDLPTPPHVIEAAYQAALQGQTKYPPVEGTRDLKEAVQAKFARDQKLHFEPDQILITNGGKQAIFNMLMAVLDEGDEVIIPAPAWAGYVQTVQFVGGRAVFVPCSMESGFRLTQASLAAAITPRTRMLILNYPNNPSGAACSAADLKDLAEILRQHPAIWILCDDIYEHLLYDGFGYATLAAVAPDLAERTLTLSGVSKSYAMTGWRIGFCGGPAALIKAMAKVQGSATAGVCSIAQAAATAALNGPQDLLATRAGIYRERRDIVVELLNQAPGLVCPKPEGAFYAFPSIEGCLNTKTPDGTAIKSDADFTTALLAQAHVGVVAGSAFAMSPHIRLSTATDTKTLQTACTRIIRFCESLTPIG